MMMMWSLVSSDVGLTYWGQTVTTACAWFSVALRLQKPSGSLERGALDDHLHFHTAPELWSTGTGSREEDVRTNFVKGADVSV